jgi:hypothetical protein
MKRSRNRYLMDGIVLLCVVGLACLIPASGYCDQFVPIYVIDNPTAGLLENGEYIINGRIGPESSIILGVRIGFRGIFHVGTSFGMQNVFDRGDVDVNEKVGFQFRLRILEEYVAPALAIGFNNQGTGFYHEEVERYDRKSLGFYVVLSKNYLLRVGQLSFHGGANYSTEDKDDNDPNIFLSSDWRLADIFSILIDVDTAMNDNASGSPFSKGGIYLDMALRIDYGQHLSLMLAFRDLTGNYRPKQGVGREFEIAFWDTF